MSNTTFDAFNLFLIPTSFVVAVSLFTQWATLELMLLYALCLFTTIAHVHYGTSVVSTKKKNKISNKVEMWYL